VEDGEENEERDEASRTVEANTPPTIPRTTMNVRIPGERVAPPTLRALVVG
jgi:hypothetical protein